MSARDARRVVRSSDVTSKKAASPDTAPKKRGRPSTGKNANLNIRVDPAARATWQAAAETSGQVESEWVREGLDTWAAITHQAHELDVNARELITEAIEARSRLRAALAELRRSSLSPTEQRVLRILDPAEWVRRFGD